MYISNKKHSQAQTFITVLQKHLHCGVISI